VRVVTGLRSFEAAKRHTGDCEARRQLPAAEMPYGLRPPRTLSARLDSRIQRRHDHPR
jgi:hypothetical protein